MGDRVCIHCNQAKGPGGFWAGRKTCIQCAKDLWYAPDPGGLDVRTSQNWPWLSKLFEAGVISYPPEAFGVRKLLAAGENREGDND